MHQPCAHILLLTYSCSHTLRICHSHRAQSMSPSPFCYHCHCCGNKKAMISRRSCTKSKLIIIVWNHECVLRKEEQNRCTTDATLPCYNNMRKLILLSWSAHIDSWRGGMGASGNRVIHSNTPSIQFHAIGSLHCLGNTGCRKRQKMLQTDVNVWIKKSTSTKTKHSIPLLGVLWVQVLDLWQGRHLVVY